MKVPIVETDTVLGPTTLETRISPEIQAVLPEISGHTIQNQLISLAERDGTLYPPSPELPTRYAVNRLALSEDDARARTYLKALMIHSGMTVEEHPLGLIATYQGTQPELPAVGMMSHFDSVPNAGMYDGTVGVMSAIHIIQALKKLGIKPKRSLKIIAVTGEESARFNIALFGSKGLFHGLTEEELDMADAHGITLKSALQTLDYDVEKVMQPFLQPEDFAAIIEFHVAQDNRYPDKLAVVEAIAAPERYKLSIGETPLEPITHTENDIFLTLSILGETGHSGATPMGKQYRTDGLVIAAEVTNHIIAVNKTLETEHPQTQILIGNYAISNQAMNKIPGRVEVPICITGKHSKAAQKLLNNLLQKEHRLLKLTHKREILRIVESEKGNTTFYRPEDMENRQSKAIQVIQAVNTIANLYAQESCVGTVSTYTTKQGCITLGIDLRGIDFSTRRKMIDRIKKSVRNSTQLKFGKPLPGSSTPESMDPGIVALTTRLLQQLQIAPYLTTFSAAGHDIQNASTAGIKTALIFCPSPNGIAHTPEEYSSSEHLEWGAKALAATVLHLAG